MSDLNSNVWRNTATCPSSGETLTTRLNSFGSENGTLLDPRLRKLLGLMEAHPLRSSQDWAITLNISNSRLQHLFKKATGVALGQALAEKRLQKAAWLLATTNLRIKEIACAVGYEHTSSFTRAFEKRFAQAPRHYRIRNAT